MAAVTTRVARPSDAETIVQNVRLGFATYGAFAPGGWAPPVWDDEAGMVVRRLASPGVWGLMAEIRGQPAGHVSLAPDGGRGDTAYLWQLFVRPAWWGTGLAGELHEAFLDAARERGYRLAHLRTPAAHARARRFYERRGWRLDGPPDDLWRFGMPLVPLRRTLAA